MPLKITPKKSSKEEKKKIVSDNIKTEMNSGAPQKQAIAIALSKQREDAKKNKKK